MTDSDPATSTLNSLKSGERSIVLSFLALSEQPKGDGQTPLDELSLSIALKSALKSPAN
ncbi:MAG: hypothetical protein QNJ13_02965 [Paracoccaceae bacterium]|nr:hypothetical protein [Paracoccaceae bacterium]